jgi:hypothetical protein
MDPESNTLRKQHAPFSGIIPVLVSLIGIFYPPNATIKSFNATNIAVDEERCNYIKKASKSSKNA